MNRPPWPVISAQILHAPRGARAGLARVLAKWPESKLWSWSWDRDSCQGSMQDRARSSLSQPTRKSLGSKKNRSQSIKGRTKARVWGPRAESRSGTSTGRGRGGVLGHALQDHSGLALCLWAWAGWAGVKGQWQGRLPQPLGIFPAQLLFCKPN